MRRPVTRVLALLPRERGGVQVHMDPLLAALSPRFEVTRRRLEAGEMLDFESLLASAPRPDWIALPDHDQLPYIPRGLSESSIPRMVWIDDAHHAPLERIRWLRSVTPALSLFTQWSSARFYAPHLAGRPLFLPHGVDPDLFHDPEAERPIDLLLYGRTDPRLYPFRHRLRRILETMHDLEVRILPHPGYSAAAQAKAVDSRAQLAAEIGRAKVTLADGGRHHLLFLRYFEIPAAGSLAAGEMLEEHTDRLGSLLVPLDPRWSDHALEAALRGLVRDHQALDERRRRACERARRFESWRARAEILERALHAFWPA